MMAISSLYQARFCSQQQCRFFWKNSSFDYDNNPAHGFLESPCWPSSRQIVCQVASGPRKKATTCHAIDPTTCTWGSQFEGPGEGEESSNAAIRTGCLRTDRVPSHAAAVHGSGPPELQFHQMYCVPISSIRKFSSVDLSTMALVRHSLKPHPQKTVANTKERA